MAQTVKRAFSTLRGILGWNGVFLLFLIVAFKLFFWEWPGQDVFACPCNWSVAYGTIMFLFPSLTSYMIAFFAYFRQHNDSAPWKPLKKFYELKFACNYYDERTEWNSDAERCIQYSKLNRDWNLVKIALSAVFSFLYPLVWLSLSFLQASYYVCAQVGPNTDVLQNYCDVEILWPADYVKALGLATIRSKATGSVLFACTLFFVGVFVILYGEILSYLSKKYDWNPSSGFENLQVQVSILPGRSSGSVGSASSLRNRNTPVESVLEAAETRGQVRLFSLFSRLGGYLVA